MKKLALLILLSPVTFCMAQENQVISSAGGSSQNGDFAISWTLGEAVTNTIQSTDFLLTQGFQQPWANPNDLESFHTSETTEFEIKIIPNPARNYFSISTPNKNNSEIQVNIVNSIGQNIFNQKFYSNDFENEFNFQIDSQTFTSGVYFVSVSFINEKVQTNSVKLIIE